MMNNNLFPLSKEGWVYLAYSFALFILFAFLDLDFLQIVSFFVFIFFLFIYRNPERQMPVLEQDDILSPVDGRVVNIDEDENDVKITLQSGYYDVSVLRIPFGSVVKSIKERKGSSLNKNSSKAPLLNEILTLEFEDKKDRVVEVSHMSTLNLTDISHDLFSTQKVLQGARYGCMLKGITQVSLPKEAKLNIKVGTEVKACESVIAYLS